MVLVFGSGRVRMEDRKQRGLGGVVEGDGIREQNTTPDSFLGELWELVYQVACSGIITDIAQDSKVAKHHRFCKGVFGAPLPGALTLPVQAIGGKAVIEEACTNATTRL